MQASTDLTSSDSGSLVGVEPMPLVTYSLTLDPAQGSLPAGTLIGANGAKATTVAGAFGVLAHNVATHATNQLGVTIYTSGSFLEARIKAANPTLTIDAAAIDALRAKNIYLERSVPISMTIPAAAPSGLEGEQQVETEEERAARQAEGERYVASAETIEARRRAEDAARMAAAEEERRRRQKRE